MNLSYGDNKVTYISTMYKERDQDTNKQLKQPQTREYIIGWDYECIH